MCIGNSLKINGNRARVFESCDQYFEQLKDLLEQHLHQNTTYDTVRNGQICR